MKNNYKAILYSPLSDDDKKDIFNIACNFVRKIIYQMYKRKQNNN